MFGVDLVAYSCFVIQCAGVGALFLKPFEPFENNSKGIKNNFLAPLEGCDGSAGNVQRRDGAVAGRGGGEMEREASRGSSRLADRCHQLGRVVSDGFTGQPGAAGKERLGAVPIWLSFVVLLLYLNFSATQPPLFAVH